MKINKATYASYTMFRQTFLLSQYLFEYNILSVQTHNIRNIFLRAGQQNKLVVSITLFLFWTRKLVPKIFCEKMENNSTGVISV